MTGTLAVVAVLAAVATVRCVMPPPPAPDQPGHHHARPGSPLRAVDDYRRDDNQPEQFENYRRCGWSSLKIMFKSGKHDLAQLDSDSSYNHQRAPSPDQLGHHHDTPGSLLRPIDDYRRDDYQPEHFENYPRGGWSSLKIMFRSGKHDLAQLDSDSSYNHQRAPSPDQLGHHHDTPGSLLRPIDDYRRDDYQPEHFENYPRGGWSSLKIMFRSGKHDLAQLDSDSSYNHQRAPSPDQLGHHHDTPGSPLRPIDDYRRDDYQPDHFENYPRGGWSSLKIMFRSGTLDHAELDSDSSYNH
ncbi:uncharacterized protein LOC133525475 isoform X2 [Cydia pomonella]|uniref:uncharacterized protein LOC133525475 isoform X2 n=1 Tax=Cydia pomonella TaxID=82600 RepID=UPI002ADDC96C|nr:uncharacterized protein LOC133525475 isoform X2 [Cydia pomonella]